MATGQRKLETRYKTAVIGMKWRSALHKRAIGWSANIGETEGVYCSGNSDGTSYSTIDLPTYNTADERVMSQHRNDAIPLWIDKEKE
jgi:hypothetical protein